MPAIPFDNSYLELGEDFFSRVEPEPVAQPRLIRFNHELATGLGIDVDALDDDSKTAIFSGNAVPEGAVPLAMVYAGHQFGGYSARLGDGRAILLGEVVANGERHDIQLKGSGRTPYSRSGDGRAALGPVLREYLLCEAMARLGIPTTRALAVASTGEAVYRDRMLPGGIITRVSRSFVRVGTFEYFANSGHHEAVRKLADHVIDRNYPQARDAGNPYEALLEQVIARQARLIAQWMQVGFIHGVMNTDNMSIVGETIDYGPCAFMDGFDHHQVYSSIDRQGRYAYGNQPAIGQWNLARFAEALLPLLLDDDDSRAAVASAEQLLDGYRHLYQEAWLDGMRRKLGLAGSEPEDLELAGAFLDLLADGNADFTLAFRDLASLERQPSTRDEAFRQHFPDPRPVDEWLARWRQRLAQDVRGDDERQAAMQAVNPLYIPRNHLIEAAIRAAEDHGDLAPFHRLCDVLQRPFEAQEGCEEYARPPRPEEMVLQTFCGT